MARGHFAGSRLVDAAAAKGGTVTTTPKGIKIWSSRSAQGGGGDAGTDAVMGIDDLSIAYSVPGANLTYDRAHAVGGDGRRHGHAVGACHFGAVLSRAKKTVAHAVDGRRAIASRL